MSDSEAPARAAIDIGTNSVHLVVARLDPGGGFEILTREKEAVRLGSGPGDMRRLDDDAIDRGIAALGRFRQLAEVHDAEIRAVATSAVREAENAMDFVTRAWDEAGVAVEIISGTEEARLIHAGVVRAVPVQGRRVLVVDIGGGSTELVVGEGPRVLDARSLKLGAIRLTERFFRDGIFTKRAVKQCRRYVEAFLAPVAAELRELGHELAVGSSGTVEAVAGLALGEGSHNAESFTRAQLDDVVATLLDAGSVKQIRRLAGVESRRADILVAGAILLEQIFAALGISELTVSDYALREGVLVAGRGSRPSDASHHHLDDIRLESVLRLAKAYEEDLVHVQRGTDLALELFDGLAEVHQLDGDARDLLEAACLLHNVGLFVSHAAHHKHSYYVIRNSDRLVGFTQREVEVIALVARYHRKSAPKPTHPEFAALSEGDRRVVEVLAAMLRVGIALDRTRAGLVEHVACTITSKRLEVHVQVRDDADASLELFTARERLGPLRDALGRAVVIDDGVG